MTTTHPDPNVSPTDPTSNPNPDDMPPANIGHPIKLDPGVTVETGHNGGDDDDGNGNGNRDDDECAQHLEELVQRLGDLDALAYCARFLLGEIPRDPSPSAEAPTRRLWRIVERIASEIDDALRFANAAVAFVRGSHRNDDNGSNDSGSGKVQS